jgi:hypothetical protein
MLTAHLHFIMGCSMCDTLSQCPLYTFMTLFCSTRSFYYSYVTLFIILLLLKVYTYTRAVCKVHGLTLLLHVGTLWRCRDGLFFKVLPLMSGALLTTFHPLHENMLQTVDHLEISCLRSPFSWLEKPRNLMGWDLNLILCLAWKKWINGTLLEHLPYSLQVSPWTLKTALV